MEPILESEVLKRLPGLGMLVCLAASFVVPWMSETSAKGRVLAWTAGLALAATCLFAVMHFTTPKEYNIRVDLIICPFLLLVPWVNFSAHAALAMSSST